METKEFEYNGKTVGFEINDQNVMVNATQMAKYLVRISLILWKTNQLNNLLTHV